MNIVLILAGGKGSRMGSLIPKQFIEVLDKPVLAYTLESFERHLEVDLIVVVTIKGWKNRVISIGQKYKISKLKYVVLGGPTGQDSTRLGLLAIKNIAKPNDLVIIHDAIRPLVPKIIVTDLLKVARLYGNACASLPMLETLILTNNESFGRINLDRNLVRRIQTPQAYMFNELLSAHLWARKNNKPSTYANTLMIDFGKTIYFSLGFINNIKLTTQEDLILFKALLNVSENELVKI
jgi:2-C-methyl-D-erythritol 4-phosphate cytidylyltransferase